MDRRAVLAGLLAAGYAAAAGAQARGPMRRLGYLTRLDDGAWMRPVLAEFGYVEGASFRLVVRNSEDAAIDAAAASMVREGFDVFFARGDLRVLALARATRTIPICAEVSDAVGIGVARTLARPGGNVTGTSFELRESAVSSIQLLQKLVPRLRRIVVVIGKGRESNLQASLRTVQEGAHSLGVQWDYATVGTIEDCEAAFGGIAQPETVIAWLTTQPKDVPMSELTGFFKRRRIATFGGGGDEWVENGALLSHQRGFAERQPRLFAILDKLLRGADPATIPFEVPDRTEFAYNRATAKALGIQAPADILLRVTDFHD